MLNGDLTLASRQVNLSVPVCIKKQEFNLLISKSVISKPIGRGGTRKPPMAFTEQGVARLSSVLKSDRAITLF